MPTKMGLGLDLSIVTKIVVLLSEQYLDHVWSKPTLFGLAYVIFACFWKPKHMVTKGEGLGLIVILCP
jgi:hypothetical protein